jgi:hypothetical protein
VAGDAGAILAAAALDDGLGADAGAVHVFACSAWRFIRGDCNGDGSTGGIHDAIAMLTTLILPGFEVPCRAACDANGDGAFEPVSDAVFLLIFNWLHQGTIPPPHPGCGPASQPSDVLLGCAEPPVACH